MPLWRCRRSKISSPKSSTDCSSPASVGAAARTKISRGTTVYSVSPCRVNLADGSSNGSSSLIEEPDLTIDHRRPGSSRNGEKNQEEGVERKIGGKRNDDHEAAATISGLRKLEAEPAYSSLRLSHKARAVWFRERAGSIEARWFARSRDKCARGWTV